MIVVVVLVAVAVPAARAMAMMMVGPTTATPHHRTMSETKAETTEIQFTTRTRTRMERSICKLATLALARLVVLALGPPVPTTQPRQTRVRMIPSRTRIRILSRTPKRVRSAHRGDLRLVLNTDGDGVGSAGSMRAVTVTARAIMALITKSGRSAGQNKRLHTDTDARE